MTSANLCVHLENNLHAERGDPRRRRRQLRRGGHDPQRLPNRFPHVIARSGQCEISSGRKLWMWIQLSTLSCTTTTWTCHADDLVSCARRRSISSSRKRCRDPLNIPPIFHTTACKPRQETRARESQLRVEGVEELGVVVVGEQRAGRDEIQPGYRRRCECATTVSSTNSSQAAPTFYSTTTSSAPSS